MNNFETFGARLYRLRMERDMNQRMLAIKIGAHPSATGYYEKGKQHPGYWALVEMAHVLNVSLDYLMLGEEHANAQHTKESQLREARDDEYSRVSRVAGNDPAVLQSKRE